MVKLDMDTKQIFDVYTKEVRSILEMAVPVWNSGLTKQQITDIERVQKVAMKIILRDKYTSYQLACKQFLTQTLENRRTKLCLKFGTKNLKSENCLFTKLTRNVNTRQKGNLVSEYKCRTRKFQRSSLPYLANLINSDDKSK